MKRSNRALLTLTVCCMLALGILYGINYVVERHPLEPHEYIIGYFFVVFTLFFVCSRKFFWEDLDEPLPRQVARVEKKKGEIDETE